MRCVKSPPMIPSELIAHYRICGKIGEGGIGAVYGAIDNKLNRKRRRQRACPNPWLPIPAAAPVSSTKRRCWRR